ncbi:CPBP family intramembrane glutamic endopeptidase [Defluviitalea raffinosedens]|uniref:CPBP family intramembrane glutamic endopeptidase n=1 Tax=Defluviitalea raffinosedens TaxID=1450156 RepID=UPI001959E4B1|nr:CPBP family intramembrane glutamic endopeptidase [Defluviitalea raffinosedens]MBM7687299.1 membrane protease YdiL (CAAX protease family) [Defluviitalea raffinosedens]
MKTKKMILSIVFSILILIISQILAVLIAEALLKVKVPEFACNIICGILYILFTYYLIKLLCKKYLNDELGNYYITKFKLESKWVVVAIFLPVIVTVCFFLFNGTFEQNAMDLNSKLSILSRGIFFTGLGAGITEEMVFRGIMLNVVEKKFNKKVAIIIPSLLFGIAHLIGINFSLLNWALVIIAGTMAAIMLALITYESKSIWNSAIVHAVWNFVIIGGVISVGTELNHYSLYSYILESKSFALTGGEFGIEASIIAVSGYCLVSLLILLANRKKSKDRLYEI